MEVHHAGASQPVGVDHGGRFVAGHGNCRCRSGSGDHHERARGPPEEIGHKVAAALVGTFLGILLCYGVVGPLAANLTKMVDDEQPTIMSCAWP